MRGLVLLPTYNERENLAAIVAAIHAARPELDILVIDDASPDGTGALADAIATADARVLVLHRQGKEGLGRAYLDGFARALASPKGYTHLIQMDADFSHDPAHLDAMLEAARDGADVVVGSRYVAGGRTVGWSRRRRLLSRAGGTYARAVLGVGVRDLTAGFVCYRRGVLEALDLAGVEASGYGFQIEMKYRSVRAGFTVVEVPIAFPDRQHGTSKMSLGIMVEALGLVWRLRWRDRGATRGTRARGARA
ncbi:MAG: polyprenol monophosphomannose synthase [Myxococcales bacterium]|nr:polyprenol monophosphomannose synthase [Myxococcales bacterium]